MKVPCQKIWGRVRLEASLQPAKGPLSRHKLIRRHSQRRDRTFRNRVLIWVSTRLRDGAAWVSTFTRPHLAEGPSYQKNVNANPPPLSHYAWNSKDEGLIVYEGLDMVSECIFREEVDAKGMLIPDFTRNWLSTWHRRHWKNSGTVENKKREELPLTECPPA